MARYATVAPKLTLPPAIPFTREEIDSLLHEYDEKVKTFELESWHKLGYRALENAKLAVRNEGITPGLSYLDSMNQILADLVTLWGLKWMVRSDFFSPVSQLTLEPDVIHRFGYRLKARYGPDNLYGWSFFENAIHGPSIVRKALHQFRVVGIPGVTVIVTNDEAIAEKDRKPSVFGLLPGETLVIVCQGGKHAEVIHGD